MRKLTVSLFNRGKYIGSMVYEAEYVTETDLVEMTKNTIHKAGVEWTRAGVGDERGILVAVFKNHNNAVELMPLINPQGEYAKYLTE